MCLATADERRARERRLQEEHRLDEAHRPAREGQPPARATLKLLRQWERMTDAFHRNYKRPAGD